MFIPFLYVTSSLSGLVALFIFFNPSLNQKHPAMLFAIELTIMSLFMDQSYAKVVSMQWFNSADILYSTLFETSTT